MKFATFLSVVTLATAVAAHDGHFCLGGCVKCYCGDTKYESHSCYSCTCNVNGYTSTNASNPMGNCDQEKGFHLGCGFIDSLFTLGECK
ncbi:hypothetical protein LY78DRAFT_664778 [Colletotrichum sublineola]|nr:hypothetical protein LY78DRAFT_664778 [Colletotrichum sublineola]